MVDELSARRGTTDSTFKWIEGRGEGCAYEVQLQWRVHVQVRRMKVAQVQYLNGEWLGVIDGILDKGKM